MDTYEWASLVYTYIHMALRNTGVQMLTHGCRLLTHLSLVDCDHITDESLVHISQHLKRLEVRAVTVYLPFFHRLFFSFSFFFLFFFFFLNETYG